MNKKEYNKNHIVANYGEAISNYEKDPWYFEEKESETNDEFENQNLELEER